MENTIPTVCRFRSNLFVWHLKLWDHHSEPSCLRQAPSGQDNNLEWSVKFNTKVVGQKHNQGARLGNAHAWLIPWQLYKLQCLRYVFRADATLKNALAKAMGVFPQKYKSVRQTINTRGNVTCCCRAADDADRSGIFHAICTQIMRADRISAFSNRSQLRSCKFVGRRELMRC